jgi:hypothetical protein
MLIWLRYPDSALMGGKRTEGKTLHPWGAGHGRGPVSENVTSRELAEHRLFVWKNYLASAIFFRTANDLRSVSWRTSSITYANAQTGSRGALLGLETATPDRDHAFGGLMPRRPQ